MQSDLNYIAQRIRALRMSKKMKQSELDDEAKLPRSSVSKIETLKREATAGEMIRIAQALGVSLDALVSSDNSFVYIEEIKVVEALREISFDDYRRILGTLEAQVYFTAKDAKEPLKEHLQELVSSLTNLTAADRRPRSRFSETKRVRD